MRMYAVKEIFYTLQGEGANAGRPAVFCRFAGCNLWSGREQDRSEAACRFCDTDFVGVDGPGGGRFATAAELGAAIAAAWQGEGEWRFVVLTGGEPMLQVDDALVAALHQGGFEVAIETNGTLPVNPLIDWVCVSPKAGASLVQRSGDELKLVYPQPELPPEAVADLGFRLLYLQPMDGPERARNTAAAVAYCKAHPQWRLSLQTHKLIGIP
jgi:7-carboxy-7-deazaguanine synthase